MASKEINNANSLEVSVTNYTGGFLIVYFAILAGDLAFAIIFDKKPDIDHTWAFIAAGFYATLRALGNIEKAILGVTNPTLETPKEQTLLQEFLHAFGGAIVIFIIVVVGFAL